MKLILKPHPACTKRGDMIDIFSDGEYTTPWTCVPCELFYKKVDDELFVRLYQEMETVVVELTIAKEN